MVTFSCIKEKNETISLLDISSVLLQCYKEGIKTAYQLKQLKLCTLNYYVLG